LTVLAGANTLPPMLALDPLAWDSALATVRTLPMNTLFVQSILCRHVDGQVWVDDARSPRAFYAVHPYGMALLWGEARGRDLAWVRDHLHASHDPPEWLQVHPEDWVAPIEAELAGVTRCTRVNFRFDRDAYRETRASVAAAIDRTTIVATTEVLFAQIKGSVVPMRFWRDAPQFVREGGGFTALVDGEPAATAFCSYRHGGELEIGIETAPRHRNQGLARLVACVLIDDCLQRGLEPVWACRLENTGSFQLATRLGFVPTRWLPYYRLPS
jgi:GNAT superfamily N-acetyltransferase